MLNDILDSSAAPGLRSVVFSKGKCLILNKDSIRNSSRTVVPTVGAVLLFRMMEHSLHIKQEIVYVVMCSGKHRLPGASQ